VVVSVIGGSTSIPDVVINAGAMVKWRWLIVIIFKVDVVSPLLVSSDASRRQRLLDNLLLIKHLIVHHVELRGIVPD
jgi:hypothetical protein